MLGYIILLASQVGWTVACATGVCERTLLFISNADTNTDTNTATTTTTTNNNSVTTHSRNNNDNNSNSNSNRSSNNAWSSAFLGKQQL